MAKKDWTLSKGDLIETLEGYSYKTLPLKFQLAIKRTHCRIEIVRWNGKFNMRYELFNRLNTGGTVLEPQEIRNCIYRGYSGEFNNFLKRVATLPDFENLIDISETKKQALYLEELVLRFVSLYANWQSVGKSITSHMDNFMRQAVENEDFDYKGIENLLFRIVNLLKPLGKEVFKGKNHAFSTSSYEAITIGIAFYIDAYERATSDFLIKKITELKEDDEYRQSLATTSDYGSQLKHRLNAAQRIFKV